MNQLEGWLPIRVYWQHTRPMVDWGYLGDLQFTDPFFDQTVNRALSHPANLLFRHQTTLEVLEEQARTTPGLKPSGFIFHMSRCGSTLVSQMLAALPSNLVISEPRPIDAVLRSHFRDPRITEEQRVQWLQWLVSALGQRRRPEQQYFFIKFDCWHTLFLPLIRRAFPEVPWVFIYRQPLEVMMSQQTQRGAQMIPGVLEPGLFGWNLSEVSQMGLDEYGARTLAKICQAVLDENRNGTGGLLNYRQLPSAVWAELLQRWGIQCTAAEVEQMAQASRFNAKNPVSLFEDDTAAKNQKATDDLRALAAQWLDGVYQGLELRRNQQEESNSALPTAHGCAPMRTARYK
jgi:hypothetical protein